jgi:type II secretory pathway component HofQ
VTRKEIIMTAKRASLTIAVCAIALTALADEMEIIALKYHSAEQLMPMLRPLVEPGGALTGMQNQLILRASRKNIEEIKKVVASVDRQPRRLMISVRQDASGVAGRREAEVLGRIGAGRASAGAPGVNERGVTARVFDSRSAGDDRVTQQLQVLEGYPAVISIGQVAPVTTGTVVQINPRANVSQSAQIPRGAQTVQTFTEYQPLTTGFEVVPRVTNDRVQLEISPHRDRPGTAGPGSIDMQRIVSTVGGRLGEWIELGGMAQDESRQGSGILSSKSAAGQDNRRVWVKVEEIK